MCIGIIILRFSAVLMSSLFILVLHLVNGAQFLITTLVFASPLVAVIPLVSRIYTSE